MTLLTEIRTDAEYEFLKLWHSCEWMIWDRYPKSIFMVSKEEVLFEQDWKNNYLFCKYSEVWSLFESKYEYNNIQIKDMISGILEEHLKDGTLTPTNSELNNFFILEEHLKNEVLTPCSNIGIGSMGVEEHLKKGSLTPYHFPFHAINELEKQIKKEALKPTYRGGYKSSQLQEKMSKETLNPEIAPIRITNLWNKVIDQVIQKLT
jgi:ATP-dependent helicase/DNAse subunit B